MATDHQTDPLKAFAEGLNLDAAVRAGPDGAPLLDEADGEELAATFTDVEAAVGAGGAVSLGKGTVYVTTRCVACGCGVCVCGGGECVLCAATAKTTQTTTHANAQPTTKARRVAARSCGGRW
jgi:hypothetical protein